MSDHEHDDGQVHGHISSIPFYLGIFCALILLTVLTYGLSLVHLGELNLALAIGIASIKATLVILFFMHLWWDKKFNALILVSTLVFMSIFLVYTMNDTATRQMTDNELGADPRGRYDARTGSWAGGLGGHVPSEPVVPTGGGHGEHVEEAAEAAPEPESVGGH